MRFELCVIKNGEMFDFVGHVQMGYSVVQFAILWNLPAQLQKLGILGQSL